VLPALAGLALYGVWKAPTVAHGPLIQRLLTPILVLAYTAFLVVITLVPDVPLVWQVTVPAALFAAVAFTAARSYGATGIGLTFGIAYIGVGIAGIGVGIAAILHHQLTFGIAYIGLGIAVIGVGIAAILHHQLTGLGIAAIGVGIAAILHHQAIGGIALIGVGIAGIGVGIAAILHHQLTGGIAFIGLGIAFIGGGIWMLRSPSVGGRAEAETTPRVESVAPAVDPVPPAGTAEGRVGRHARPD
jgi:hypothetical protein